jgi:hypothetical protein
VIIGICPWGWAEWRAFTKENIDDSFSKFLFIWAATIFIFFTISSAKLPHYILPMIAPMAMLAAKRIDSKPRLKWTAVGVMSISLILSLAVLDPLLRIWYKASGQQEAHYLVRKHPEIQVLYQLSRREKEMNTGTTKLQETSLPSLLMYLDKEVVETDDEHLVFDVGIHATDIQIKRSYKLKPGESYPPVLAQWLFTRKSRLASLASNHRLIPIEETENFGVYELKVLSP